MEFLDTPTYCALLQLMESDVRSASQTTARLFLVVLGHDCLRMDMDDTSLEIFSKIHSILHTNYVNDKGE